MESFGWKHAYLYDADFVDLPIQQFFIELNSTVESLLKEYEETLKAVREYKLYEFEEAKDYDQLKKLRGDEY